MGAVLPARRLHAGATTSPRSIPRSSQSSRSCSGRRPRSTTSCRCWAAFSVFFGILPPMPTITTHTFYGDVQNIASGMIPRVYGHSYAIEAELSRARRRSRGRDRRRSGRDGRLLALGRRHGAAAPQLLDDGRRAVPASLDRADPDRRRHRPHAVRRRHAGTLRRRNGVALRERPARSAKAGSKRPCRSGSPATAAWTSAATTAWSSTAPTRPRLPTHSPAP